MVATVYTYTLTQKVKTRYQALGKDRCPICKKECLVGEEVTRTYHGNGCKLYHADCYGRSYILV